MDQANDHSPDFYYIIHLPQRLAPSESITLSISYALLSSVDPLPAIIEQASPQTIVHAFSAYLYSAYDTQKQKTKVKLPTSPADYTKLPEQTADKKDDPVVQGSSVTYGPYENIKPGSVAAVKIRYEFTKPLLHASLLERDIEVSHFGGNLATEERYWLTNRAAKLKGNQFSRVQWQMTQYSNPPTTAAKEIQLPLLGGASNPYYVDDIGNVSTSKFRPGSGAREANLAIKPRYPIFGGWNYSFKVGWDADLRRFLRKSEGDQYVLKVPFLEGPRTSEGIEYSKVILRVVLPEGAT
jgi:oligosaccharyltransferase complex subunit alpha (ribophorin I)